MQPRIKQLAITCALALLAIYGNFIWAATSLSAAPFRCLRPKSSVLIWIMTYALTPISLHLRLWHKSLIGVTPLITYSTAQGLYKFKRYRWTVRLLLIAASTVTAP
ncbi:hypothetical protein K503DRAFT_240792 [Rhizopogon vinicolor AM-OR11-026]|uniref:Uncharacterized protein n=1 Tax=Rhizopogon vinicolor AM-OR11-026 TaxID=1314800 RepID=A0A1B7MXN1_9AGAM|nr:hypothetical protein K503DRAFT_240792 [Rhizopogon vinicolor AM-OR11-026]